MNRSLKIPGLIVFDETEQGEFDVVHVRSEDPVARVCNLGCDPGWNGKKTRDMVVGQFEFFRAKAIRAASRFA